MALIPVYSYSLRTGNSEEARLSFDRLGVRALAGQIAVPDGSEIHVPRGTSAKRLKVPRFPGAASDFLLFSAPDAVEAASAGDYGMAWEPAP